MIRLFHVYMSDAAKENAAKVLAGDASGRINLTQGPVVDEFEQALKNHLGTPYEPLTVNSCTSALTLALHLAGVREGDEVISTPMTCTATNAAIVSRGARIVWADVWPETGLVIAEDVHRKMTPATKAIMAVDWGGALCDFKTLKSYGVPVIEDAAHAMLAVRDGFGEKNNCGDYVCWSFQAIKHLTTADGGALLAPPDQMDRARLLRWYGMDRRSNESFRVAQNVTESGYKFNMNDLNAAIGLGNVKDIEMIVRQHRANAAYYSCNMYESGVVIINEKPVAPQYEPGSAWWLYTLMVDNPGRFIKYMKTFDIEAGQVHGRNDRHNAYAFYSGRLPGVDAFSKYQVSIPVGWWLSVEDRDKVVAAVKSYRGEGY